MHQRNEVAIKLGIIGPSVAVQTYSDYYFHYNITRFQPAYNQTQPVYNQTQPAYNQTQPGV